MLVSKNILAAINLAKNKQLNASDILLQETEIFLKSSQTPDEKQLQSIQKIREIYKISKTKFEKTDKDKTTTYKTTSGNEWDYLKHGIDYPTEKVMPGVSLVTCCMNRSENLIKAIKTWLDVKEINEIIIVDWSSTIPVAKSLDEAEIKDKKILVIRVENQPRWILSYAFNIGFRASKFEKILKTDADITIKPDFFSKNTLGQNEFIAGNWRKAPKGQEHVNGFFYIHRSNLMKIKGFNEHITTYGWDDDDIYGRMHNHGLKRIDVDLSSIYHIPHDDSLRIPTTTTTKSYLEELHENPKFKIRFNRFIANCMPEWNFGRAFIPIKVTSQEKNTIYANQTGDSFHLVPKHITDDALYYAEAEMTSWRGGVRAFQLDKTNLRKLLHAKSIAEINELDIEVAIYNANRQFNLSKNYLILKTSPELSKKQSKFITDTINTAAKKIDNSDFGILLATDNEAHVQAYLEKHPFLGYVPQWRNLGKLKEIKNLSQLKISGEHDNIIIDLDSSLKEIHDNNATGTKTQPQKRDSIFIDAQHGLGNRLRAIASAAAIAHATSRNLRIIWEPDHHCECELTDIFDFSGDLINKTLLHSREVEDMDVFNYIEIEANAKKDAPIICTPGRDIYIRSAYTLKHPASTWESECIFLQSLKPTEQVQHLVNQFPNIEQHIGVHIRMEAGKGLDHNTYDSIDNWTKEGHDQLHFWREKSHYSAFIKKMEEILRSNPSARFFLATDLPENYQILSSYFNKNLTYLQRTHFDRSKSQIVSGLADAILLSKCNRLLGSTWSSFSELAMRLSRTIKKIEMSGVDF